MRANIMDVYTNILISSNIFQNIPTYSLLKAISIIKFRMLQHVVTTQVENPLYIIYFLSFTFALSPSLEGQSWCLLCILGHRSGNQRHGEIRYRQNPQRKSIWSI